MLGLDLLWRRRRLVLFLALHVAAIVFAIIYPPTWTSFWLVVGTYYLRMFGISAGFHRYFAHRSFQTGRIFQLILAFLGAAALQKGALWWASNHRKHHAHTDDADDPHSPLDPATGRPTLRTMFWGHVGWVFAGKSRGYDPDDIKEFSKYPELRWLEKVHILPGLLMAAGCWWIDGWSGLGWGFFVGTVVLYHLTFCVNSVCHLWGWRPYDTEDGSRNNPVVAVLGMGEGWHNNHHRYQASARQGFRWWEIDLSWYLLWSLKQLGVVWRVAGVPEKIMDERRSPEPAEPSAA